MRLVTFYGHRGDLRTGAISGGRVIDLTQAILDLAPAAPTAERGLAVPPGGMMRLLHSGPDGLAVIRRLVDDAIAAGGRDRHPLLRDIRLAAPVPRPGKIVAIGRNYADHAKETGVQPFERPRIIAKLPSSVVGPEATVRRPDGVTKLDLEAELAVVIGQFASQLPPGQGLKVVAGYTILNDVSAREFQFDVSPAQTTFAKSMDGFCPMGPWLVTADEIADPQALEIRSFLNGKPMQHGNTRDMLFPVNQIIEYVSQYMTLEPGDVIATGTPAGSGAFRDPPVWLKPGDRVRIDISHIGSLEHGIG
jgi:2-keto-4-pentenoate hydratase/2-oxohepta-3-ene-1,7-dioic acid hydratase in catechol pathway